jgi:hypothetical protein
MNRNINARTFATVALAATSMTVADVWSPMDFYIGLGKPEQGDTQSGGSDWTFRRGAFNGDLLVGMPQQVTCEQGIGLWGTAGGEYGFIPNVGPRLSPDEQLDDGTGQYKSEFDGLMVIPGTAQDAFLVFTADGPMTIPALTLRAKMVYTSTDGVLVSVKTRIAGVTTTWLDSAHVPPGDEPHQEWVLFGGGGPTLQDNDRLWIQVNINANIYGDWTNISLESGGCYADCTGDQGLDLFDFLCFVNDFNAEEGYADCDGNETFDLFDFLCFVNQFNAGC